MVNSHAHMGTPAVAEAAVTEAIRKYRVLLAQAGDQRQRVGEQAGRAVWVAPAGGDGSRVATLVAPVYARHEDEQRVASLALRDALLECGVLEQRAIVTGRPEHMAAYLEGGLAAVTAAGARLYAVSAAGAIADRSAVDATRTGLEAQLAALLAERGRSGQARQALPLVRANHRLERVRTALAAAVPVGAAALSVVVEPPTVTVETRDAYAKRRAMQRRNAHVSARVRGKGPGPGRGRGRPPGDASA
jgi:hypothetical protein